MGIDPTSAGPWINLAKLHRADRDHLSAVNFSREAYARMPVEYRWREWAADSLRARNAASMAMAIDEAQRKGMREAATRLRLAELHDAMGRMDQAVRQVRSEVGARRRTSLPLIRRLAELEARQSDDPSGFWFWRAMSGLVTPPGSQPFLTSLPDDATSDEPATLVTSSAEVGSWRFRWERQALVLTIRTQVTDLPVTISVDGVEIKSVDTSGRLAKSGKLAPVLFRLRLGALHRLPRELRIEVRCGDSLLLPTNSSDGALPGVILNRFSQSDRVDLGSDVLIDKKGNVVLRKEADPAWQEAALSAIEKASRYFNATFGRKLWLTYGTLLGKVREEGFISHDDDLDLAYFSSYRTPTAVRAEMKAIVSRMVSDGWTMLIGENQGGVLMPVIDGFAFDIFPSWHDGDHFWMPTKTSLELDSSMFSDLEPASFCGVDTYTPRDPERFLEAKYGEGWRTPDSAYRATFKRTGVKEELTWATLHLPDLLEMRESLKAAAGSLGWKRFEPWVSRQARTEFPVNDHKLAGLYSDHRRALGEPARALLVLDEIEAATAHTAAPAEFIGKQISLLLELGQHDRAGVMAVELVKNGLHNAVLRQCVEALFASGEFEMVIAVTEEHVSASTDEVDNEVCRLRLRSLAILDRSDQVFLELGRWLLRFPEVRTVTEALKNLPREAIDYSEIAERSIGELRDGLETGDGSDGGPCSPARLCLLALAVGRGATASVLAAQAVSELDSHVGLASGRCGAVRDVYVLARLQHVSPGLLDAATRQGLSALVSAVVHRAAEYGWDEGLHKREVFLLGRASETAMFSEARDGAEPINTNGPVGRSLDGERRPGRSHPPRVAVCLFGQARAFEKVSRTVSFSGEAVSSDTFASLWAERGIRYPDTNHAKHLRRFLPDRMCDVIDEHNVESVFLKEFPAVDDLVRSIASRSVDSDYVASVLGAPAERIEVESDSARFLAESLANRSFGPLSGVPNQMRKLYKMRRVLDVLVRDGSEFDVVVLARPDIDLSLDLNEDELDAIAAGQLLFDNVEIVGSRYPVIVDDKCFVGAPATIRSLVTLWDEVGVFSQRRGVPATSYQVAHVLPADYLFAQGIPMRKKPGLSVSSDALISERLSPAELESALSAGACPAHRRELLDQLLASLR